MFRVRTVLAAVIAGALAGGACSTTPTSPSTTTSGVLAGVAQLEPPATPQVVIPVNPPNRLGATSFMAFGDSITAGVLSSFDGAFLFDAPAQAYNERLLLILNSAHAGQSFSVINRGAPGERASQGESRLPGELNQHRPRVLLLLEGINDMIGGVSPERAASSVLQLVQIARLYNVTVLVATMPQTFYSVSPTGVIRENARTQIVPFNTEVRRLVEGLPNVYVVDLYSTFGTDQGAGLMGNDGLHPTPAGYQRMAEAFYAAIVTRFPVYGSVH